MQSSAVARAPARPPSAAPAALPLERITRELRRRASSDSSWSAPAADDWPHTKRVLPWMIAGFLVLIWLVPINSISLRANLPFELRLDRIVLPFVGLMWVLSLVTRGADRPKLRVTWLHFAVGLFIGIAFLSDVLAAHQLNQNLELTLALKKLVLLGAYGSLFVIIASTVRRTEVRAFMTYIMWLALLCGLGTLYEYHFKHNLFYGWSGTLLPSNAFQVASVNAAAVDDIGRRLTVGPAQTGLETASMLAMALPIALIKFTGSKGWKRLGYTIAAAIVLSATISTYKKTAFIAPVVVLLTFAIFRPRDLLRLVPLAVVLLAFVHVLAPGSFGSIAAQLGGGQLTSVGTTAHRTVAYDAIRPDVWSHVLIGRGYGSYDQVRYRIIDNTVLDLLIGVGTLGVIAFLAMPLTAIGVAAPIIRARDGLRAPVALPIAAAAAVFAVVSCLYDSMAYPHLPYIFMSLVALLAVLVGTGGANPRAPDGDRAIEPRRLQSIRSRRGFAIHRRT